MPLEFDVPTLILLTGIVALVQAYMVFSISTIVTEYDGILFATAGNANLAIGLLLFLTRGFAPDWLSIIVANGLVLGGILFHYIALNKFTSQAINRFVLILPLSLCLAGLAYFTYINDNLAARIILVSIAGIALLAGSILTLNHADKTKFHTSTYRVSIPFMFFSLLLGVRVITTIFAPPVTFFENTFVQAANYIILFMVIILGTAGFNNMIIQRLQTDLRISANTDFLTGVPNRRAAVVFMENELARQLRNINYLFSVLLIDIDHFKIVNDTHGHDGGDIVLSEVSRLFRETIRTQDFLARWGGDEFMITLPMTNSFDAKALGQRMRKLLERTEFEYQGSILKLTISVGVSDSVSSKSIDDVIKRADIALYKSKVSRNTVTLEIG